MQTYRRKIARIQRFIEALHKEEYPNAKSFSRSLKQLDEKNDTDLSASPKTIQREIHALIEDYNAPIHYDSSAKGFFLSVPDWNIPQSDLNADEIFANIMSMKLSYDRMPAPLLPTLHDLEDIQFAALSGDQFTVDALDSLIVKGDPSLNIDKESFKKIIDAWQKNKTLEIQYYAVSSDTTSLRKIDVHALVLANDIWYAHSHCHKRNDFRSFALHRIKSLEVTDEVFSKNLHLVQNLKKGNPFSYEMIEGVKIDASHKVAHIIAEREWFQGQENVFKENGVLQVYFPDAPKEQLLSWVLSFGGELNIIEPTCLHKLYCNTIKSMYSWVQKQTN